MSTQRLTLRQADFPPREAGRAVRHEVGREAGFAWARPQPAGVLEIDMTRCEGRGLCVELLPKSLDRDRWGYPLARDASGRGTTRAEVSEEQLQAAKDAAALCPVRALRLARRR